ncbi:MAG: hypothetical protein A2075_04015 [Geobacteraceae bacterium GWC2_58_44]|nr:MAG: hypothetical protein A2075_04015 [Geobacteraceae bacterium GWC2_58_44]
MVALTIVVGRAHALYLLFIVSSFAITYFWRSAPRPWICLVSIVAATPIPLFRQQVACNLLFAFALAVFNANFLFKLPKWTYVPAAMALMGVLTSSFNWLSESVIGSILRQGAFVYNFLVSLFIFLPLIYFRMRESRDHEANLRGLLFCLILPSTAILLTTKLVGIETNVYENSLHVGSLAEGYLDYLLGRVVVNFHRTEVGFILAALICASTAIAVSRVRLQYRLVAAACSVSNIILLLSTGSFGSGSACLVGLAAIFYAQFRVLNPARCLASMAVLGCSILLIYSLFPSSGKKYLEKRYQVRVTNRDQDRVVLWTRAMGYILENPEGVGLTFTVGDKVKTNPHNDYLLYTVSYGFLGGLAYLYLVTVLLLYFIQVRNRKIEDHSAFAIHLAGLGVVVALALNSMTDHLTNNRWYFNVIWSIVWYSYFCSQAAHRQPVSLEADGEAAKVERMASHGESIAVIA